MAETTNLRDPILVAIWPGMGSVALVAGDYLLEQLRARRIDITRAISGVQRA